MGTLADLLDWWNLVFVLPITLSVLLLLASAVGGLGDGDAHAHADMDAHAQVDADGHADHDADADHPLADALKFVGVGVVPISLLLQAFLLLFGVLGLAANRS